MIEITNDEELARVAEEVSERLQAMQDYMGNSEANRCLIKFPRGYLMTASTIRKYYPFIDDPIQKSNTAYTVTLIQSIEWLLTRTDIGLTARSMLCKLLIVLRGSLAEFLLIDAVGTTKKRLESFEKRATKLRDERVISDSLKNELCWLWDTRCNIHLDKPSRSEHLKYGQRDADRAVHAVVELRAALKVRAVLVRAFTS